MSLIFPHNFGVVITHRRCPYTFLTGMCDLIMRKCMHGGLDVLVIAQSKGRLNV